MDWEQRWDEIYKTQGEVQRDILPTAAMAAELFSAENVKTVLDLGCGMGRHTVYFASLGFAVTATDISEKGVETTRAKAEEMGLKIKTLCHDMRKIPFPDSTFGAVFCIWTSGHGFYEDMVHHAREMLRVVKDGGYIFVDYVSKKDVLYGRGRELEKDTFVDNTPGEEDIPHHYTDEEEIRGIYAGHDVRISPYTYTFRDSWDALHEIKALVTVCKK